MPLCCQWNGGGKCRNCVCAKANRLCTKCLPPRKGCCSNIAPKLASPTLVPVQDASAPLFNDSPTAPTSSSPTADSQPIHSLSDNVSSRPSSAPSNLHSRDSAHSSPSLPPLPSPTLLANPSFVWGSLDANSFMHCVSYAYSEMALVILFQLNCRHFRAISHCYTVSMCWSYSHGNTSPLFKSCSAQLT